MSTTCPRAVSIRIGVVTPRCRDLAADVEAVHPRQHHVEHDEVVAAARRAREAGLAVARGLDGVAFAAEPIAERQPQPGFVLDEEDARRQTHRRWQPSPAARRTACRMARRRCRAGRSTVDGRALAGTAVDLIVPPCASTTWRTTLSPTPVPRTCASIGPAAAIERLEDVRQIVGVDAEPAIGDANPHRRADRRSAATSTVAPPGTVLDRVADDVLHRRPKRVGVARAPAAACPLACTVNRDAAVARIGGDAVDRVGDHRATVHVGRAREHGARADAGKLHDALDHVAQPAPLGFDERLRTA